MNVNSLLKKATDLAENVLAVPSIAFGLAFGFVIDRLREKNYALSDSQLERLKELVSLHEEAVRPQEQRRQEFLTKYDVKVLAEGQVRLTLPKGTSRLDLLHEAQVLVPELLQRPAVYTVRLAQWAKDPNFTTPVSEATTMSIDGNVKGSTHMSEDEQKLRGWNNVDLADLAVAHQAYLIAKKRDLFSHNDVRARVGVLCFGAAGLGSSNRPDGVYGCFFNQRSPVAASAYLPFGN